MSTRPVSEALHSAIRAVCPIVGVSIGRVDDKATWRIDFDESATPAQRTAASGVAAAFDVQAFLRPPTPDEIEAEVQSVLAGQAPTNVDAFKLLKAKMISDLAFRLGVAPGALTGAQLGAERARIAAIYKAL